MKKTWIFNNIPFQQPQNSKQFSESCPDLKLILQESLPCTTEWRDKARDKRKHPTESHPKNHKREREKEQRGEKKPPNLTPGPQEKTQKKILHKLEQPQMEIWRVKQVAHTRLPKFHQTSYVTWNWYRTICQDKQPKNVGLSKLNGPPKIFATNILILHL